MIQTSTTIECIICDTSEHTSIYRAKTDKLDGKIMNMRIF